MQKLKKWIITPYHRLGTAFLLIVGGAFLSTLFVPFAAFAFAGVILLLMLGQRETVEWTDSKEIDCPVCGEVTPGKLMERKEYMYPLIPFVGKNMSIYLDSSYFLVCDKCLQTHVGKQDIIAIMVIAQGGLAHAKEISKQEYDQMKK